MNIDFLDDKFLVLAHCSPPHAMFKNNDNESLMETGYKLLNEGGFNLTFGYYEHMPNDKQSVLKALKLAEQYGIGYLVSDDSLNQKNVDFEKFRENLAVYKDSKAFAGNYYYDEPGKTAFNLIASVNDAYKLVCPDKLLFVNLQGSNTPDCFRYNGMRTQVDSSCNYSYEEYLKDFFETAKINYLSFDFYPFTKEEGSVEPEYFIQLAKAYEASKTYNVPFISYIQSCSWNLNEARVPTENEILWQVTTTLAYNASGIAYFCFWTPYSNQFENRDVAMVDFDGNPTPRYYAGVKANELVHEYYPKLKKLNFQGIYQTGNSPCLLPYQHYMEIDEISGIDGDVFSSWYLDENGIKHVFVVANWITSDKKRVRVNFKKLSRFEVYMEGKNKIYCEKYVEKELAGGEVFLLKINS